MVTSPFHFFQEKLENSNIKEGLLESLGGETLTVSKGDGHNTITMFNGHSSVIIKPDIQVSMFLQGILKGEVSLYHWPPVDWFGISCMTTDNICFYLWNRLIQTSQTGGQWYSDTSPFSIPWFFNLSPSTPKMCQNRLVCLSLASPSSLV